MAELSIQVIMCVQSATETIFYVAKY